MSIEAYTLRDAEHDSCGAVLVCNTSGRVLNLPIRTFEDIDAAESFLAWCNREAGVGDPRKLGPAELEAAVEGWREWNEVAP